MIVLHVFPGICVPTDHGFTMSGTAMRIEHIFRSGRVEQGGHLCDPFLSCPIIRKEPHIKRASFAASTAGGTVWVHIQ